VFVVFRWWYFAGVGGLVASVLGGIETSLALKSGAEPVPVTIEQLTNGTLPPQPWVRLGPHVALLDHAAWLESRGRVRAAFHPVVAADHPYLEAWRVLTARHGNPNDVPVGQLPRLSGVRAVVESKSRPGDAGIVEVASAEGMLFAGSSLSRDEEALVESRFHVDARQLLVLEVNRRPWPIAFAIGALVLGLATLGWAIRRFRRQRAAPA
jgi:hypothetical protein